MCNIYILKTHVCCGYFDISRGFAPSEALYLGKVDPVFLKLIPRCIKYFIARSPVD